MKPREMDTAGLRIGSVVIDCVKFDEMLEFWKEALNYNVIEPVGKGFAILRDPSHKNTNVSLNKVRPSEKLTGRNWLHFDLYTNDQQSEVKRLLELGATRNRQTYRPEDDFIVLKDPDANLFCVVDATWKVVDTKDLSKLVKRDWEFKAKLAGGKTIVGKKSSNKARAQPERA